MANQTVTMDTYFLTIYLSAGGDHSADRVLETFDHKVRALSSWDALDQGYNYVRERWAKETPASIRISVKKTTPIFDGEYPM